MGSIWQSDREVPEARGNYTVVSVVNLKHLNVNYLITPGDKSNIIQKLRKESQKVPQEKGAS